jgi:hypothetical protein
MTKAQVRRNEMSERCIKCHDDGYYYAELAYHGERSEFVRVKCDHNDGPQRQAADLVTADKLRKNAMNDNGSTWCLQRWQHEIATLRADLAAREAKHRSDLIDLAHVHLKELDARDTTIATLQTQLASANAACAGATHRGNTTT